MNSICLLFAFLVFNSAFTNSTEISKQPMKIDLMPKTNFDSSNNTAKDTISKQKAISKPNIDDSFISKLYATILTLIKNFLSEPKVNNVMRDISTCMVNGMVELVTFYIPAPLVPIIASAAGMLIPFEPVLAVRDQVPVTSYRRAFMSALNSFLGTFDNRYNLNSYNDGYDPYMKGRFNRRMMQHRRNDKDTRELDETVSPSRQEIPVVKGNKGNIIYGINKLFNVLEKMRKGSNEDEPQPKFDS